MISGINDPVVMALQQKGLPPTAENYNRMTEALRMGGHTGNSAQPVTKEMRDTMRAYGPTGDEPAAMDISGEEDALDDEAYLDSLNEVRTPTPPASVGNKQMAQPASGPVAAPAPFSPMDINGQMTPMPPTAEDGMSIDPMAATLGTSGALGMALKQMYDAKQVPQPAPQPTGAKMLAPPVAQKQLPAPQQQITDQRPKVAEPASAKSAPEVIEAKGPKAPEGEKKPAPDKKKLREKATAAMSAEKKAARIAARRIK